jgi:hypothetical protein
VRCDGPLKTTGKKWKFNSLEVEAFKCAKCGKNTNTYSREGKVLYTIPKKKNK